MPNFARVPDHAVRGVWMVTNIRMTTETPDCVLEEKEEQEQEQDGQEERQFESQYDHESPIMTVPSQWGTIEESHAYAPDCSSEYTTYAPFQRNYQLDSRDQYETIPMPPTAFAQNTNPMQYPCGSQTEWMPLQDILTQYPDLFRNIPLKQTI